jgi:hypothetical protein
MDRHILLHRRAAPLLNLRAGQLAVGGEHGGASVSPATAWRAVPAAKGGMIATVTAPCLAATGLLRAACIAQHASLLLAAPNRPRATAAATPPVRRPRAASGSVARLAGR